MSSIDSISQALSRDIQHLAIVSQNIANVNTPGYQQRLSFDQALLQSSTFQTVVTNSEQAGAIRSSQRPLDFAITGEGYFVLMYQGETMLSRDGRFHINSEGYLAHSSGALLQSAEGDIHVSGIEVSIAKDGTIRDRTGVVAHIQLRNTTELVPVASGLYAAQSQTPVVEAQIQTQALNASSVNPGTETVRMMELSRHLQSLQKAAQTYDQMLYNGINELGKSK